MTDDQLRRDIEFARANESKFGPGHTTWDLIAHAEQMLEGKPVPKSREEIEGYFSKYRNRVEHHRQPAAISRSSDTGESNETECVHCHGPVGYGGDLQHALCENCLHND